MNEICPYCGEPQRYPIDCMDTIVYCGRCAKPFLCSRRPRDEVPRWSPTDRQIRNLLTALFYGSLVVVFLLTHVLIFFW